MSSKQQQLDFGILTFNFAVINILLPIIIGGFIYLIRPGSVLMFEWFKSIGIPGDWIVVLRNHLIIVTGTLPDWVGNYLPDALWMYSFSCFIGGLWYKKSRLFEVFWFSVVMTVGIGFEIAQLFQFIPGTFDVIDIITYLIAAYISRIVIGYTGRFYI
ncbi:MAG TPA: hypothetical protein GXX58_10045 [Gelria sp.]|nr:hypothetical protein [Syntrophomonadaceae bacterium]HHV16892.1 hypothetical protein [Gelria sp.]